MSVLSLCPNWPFNSSWHGWWLPPWNVFFFRLQRHSKPGFPTFGALPSQSCCWLLSFIRPLKVRVLQDSIFGLVLCLSIISSYPIVPSLIASDNMYMLVTPQIYFFIPNLFPGLLTQILNSSLGINTGMPNRHLGCNMPHVELLNSLLQSCSLPTSPTPSQVNGTPSFLGCSLEVILDCFLTFIPY